MVLSSCLSPIESMIATCWSLLKEVFYRKFLNASLFCINSLMKFISDNTDPNACFSEAAEKSTPVYLPWTVSSFKGAYHI